MAIGAILTLEESVPKAIGAIIFLESIEGEATGAIILLEPIAAEAIGAIILSLQSRPNEDMYFKRRLTVTLPHHAEAIYIVT